MIVRRDACCDSWIVVSSWYRIVAQGLGRHSYQSLSVVLLLSDIISLSWSLYISLFVCCLNVCIGFNEILILRIIVAGNCSLDVLYRDKHEYKPQTWTMLIGIITYLSCRHHHFTQQQKLNSPIHSWSRLFPQDPVTKLQGTVGQTPRNLEVHGQHNILMQESELTSRSNTSRPTTSGNIDPRRVETHVVIPEGPCNPYIFAAVFAIFIQKLQSS